jgi:hypothetical protein
MHIMSKLRLLSVTLLFLVSAAFTHAADGVDTSPLPIKTVRAFPNLKPRRPVAITHAADGSKRLFIVSEYGQLLIMPTTTPRSGVAVTPDESATQTHAFLDIEYKVDYEDKENEEGLLGLAFHPKYKENGQFFIYYTAKEPPHTSVISRLTVSKDDPNKADPKSEEVLLTIKQPYWNHNGGNLLFGPDGYLYIGLGDGGSANDPHNNGQKMSTMLGKILRIDVDRKDAGKAYAIPKDNPFVGKGDAVPEIFALGVRNIWGMSFDPVTKLFYAADVGQNLWEEINIIENGGQLRLERARVVSQVRQDEPQGDDEDGAGPHARFAKQERSQRQRAVHRPDLGISPRHGWQVDHRRHGVSREEAAGTCRLLCVCRLCDRQDMGPEVRREGEEGRGQSADCGTGRLQYALHVHWRRRGRRAVSGRLIQSAL